MRTTPSERSNVAISRVLAAPITGLASVGDRAIFYGRGFAWVGRVITRYKREQLRLIGEIGMGSGTLAVVGGSIAITGMIVFFTGIATVTTLYPPLKSINLTAFTGFGASYILTRLSVPLIVGAGLAATVGTSITAELGAMRINEEVDALEVMGIRSLPYLVSTRIVAVMVVTVPIYLFAQLAAYTAYKLYAQGVYGVSAGGYQHYFDLFLQPFDIVFGAAQAFAMAVVIVLVHSYYGYTASGGPAGVGEAVGRAVRTSLIVVTSTNLLVSMALYGGIDTFRISG